MSAELERLINATRPYHEWALEQRKQYIDLRLQQDPEVRALYIRAADRIAEQLKELNARGSSTLTMRHLETLEQELTRQGRMLTIDLEEHVEGYVALAVQTGSFFNERVMVEALKGADLAVTPFKESVQRVNQEAVQTIIGRSRGGLFLSDRVWRTGERTQDAIRNIIQEAVATGESPLRTAELLEKYVRNERKTVVEAYPQLFERIKPPRDLAYEALRLARTETTAAYGEGTIASANISPSTTGIQWLLSPSHPIYDICDELAAHEEGLGRGVYRKDNVPAYPPHPNCLCTLVPTLEDTDDLVARLKEWRRNPNSHPDLERWYQNVSLSA